jgi:transcriptional regulator of acetoin/glycerol metabolism/DNA-binding CsgD family transcriptional regulator
MRGEIAESWARCVSAGLSPGCVDARSEAGRRPEEQLMQAAAPVLDYLEDDLGNLHVGVVLADAAGRIVDRRVSQPFLRAALERANIARGFVHTESTVGTNGIGTALVQRRPVAVNGGEHFAEVFRDLASVGAPVVDLSSGRIVGVVELVCLAVRADSLMLPLAKRAAREIEQSLVDNSGVSERVLLQSFLRARRGRRGAFVFITPQTMITNAAADRLVSAVDEARLRAIAGQLMREADRTSIEVLLRGDSRLTVRCEPIFEGRSPGGAMLQLNPAVVADADRQDGRSVRLTYGWDSLSETEHSVIGLIARGCTNREAGEQLFMSRYTVDAHLRSIYRKLGVHSRVELTRIVMERAGSSAS